MSYITKSPWLVHYDGSSCNGCDIEVLACLTPLYDVERFGIVPENTLLIDDGRDNIMAARNLGFHGLLIPEGEEFDEVLTKYLSGK